jgi:hypothetical protein
MRIPFCIALALALPCAATAGPIRVQIDTAAEVPDPFLVSVNGHYADFHLGYSRHWKDALLRPGRRRSIDLGPVNPLLNMGVSVTIYHPEYVAAYARSKKTPLLVRPVGFETFRPRAWRDAMASGEGPDAGNAAQALNHVVGHLQLFLDAYLPAVDAAQPDDAVSDARLRQLLPFFDALVQFGAEEAQRVQPSGWVGEKMEEEPAFARSMARQALEQCALMHELLRRTQAWLSVPRDERAALRELMRAMRYPRSVGEDLMTADDRAELGAFLERYAEDRSARREPETSTSWINPENRVAYRVHAVSPPRECAYLSITADVTGVVTADVGDMVHTVKANFCRRASGEWRYGR